MRVFRFFDRKKKLPGLLRAPACSSSVHPASNGQDGHRLIYVNRAKVMEILGVVSQKECLEIDDLLNKNCLQVDSNSVTDDDESTEGNIEDDDAAAQSRANQKTTPDLSQSRCVVTPTQNAVQGPPISSSLFKLSPSRPSTESARPRPFSLDLTAKAKPARGLVTARRGVKPSELQCVADTAMVWMSAPRHTTSPRPSDNKGKYSARYKETFPLPLPSPEKHYLPSPRTPILKEVHSIAHPLPHPPASLRSFNQHGPGCISGKGDIGCLPTPSCDSPSKPTQQATPPHCSMTNSYLPYRSPPETPPHRLHPQPSVRLPDWSHSPPSSTKQSPRLSRLSSSQPPPHLSSWQLLTTNSPPWSPAPKGLCPHKWTKGAILGQGTFGTVYEGFNMEDGSFFAVKVSSREDVSPEIQQEVDVLSKLEHPNIVRYFGSSVEEGRLCIFLELVRMGSLESILRKYTRFEDDTVRSYTRQILLGLEYLHAKKTIHRDIKCANILVDVNGQVKLSDFGVAKQVGESLASSVKGTPLYMAPEVLTPNNNCYGFPADIWSLGCTVLEMADGKPPWSNLKGFGFLFKVKKGELPPMPEHLSSEGKDFICKCLKYHPKDRPTAIELLQHPFVVNVCTPEPFIPWSPPSPVSPIGWPPSSPSSFNTWACGKGYLSSPSHASCFDQVLAGAQRAQTLLHGR